MNIWPQWGALTAWWRTRRLAKTLRTRADIEAWQGRQLARLLRDVLQRSRFYRDVDATGLEDLPVVDKRTLMSRFQDFNVPGITADEGWAALKSGGRWSEFHVGASTGTSGNRGLYVISERERWQWLGTMIAKTMPRLRRARIALILPLDTSLYAAARGGLLKLRFFDLKRGLAACGEGIAALDPDTLIAPPKVLRWLVHNGGPLRRVRHVFSAAEVLDPRDREIIEAHFGVVVREIYMATEGLLGVACEHGTLHLCEDCVKFEYERPVPGSDLVTPIITDFSRQTQAMVRYRMNDLLRLQPAPCPCGSPLQAVAQVEGRMDDLLHLRGTDGVVIVTPDVMRNAIVGADRRIDDFRLVQTAADRLELSLTSAVAAEAAKAALERVLGAMGAPAKIDVTIAPMLEVSARKLRRVERRWQPEDSSTTSLVQLRSSMD
jgi:putative adenylate-forming enzyme